MKLPSRPECVWWGDGSRGANLVFFRRRSLLLLPTPLLALCLACIHVSPPGAFGWGQSDQKGHQQPRTVPGTLAWEVEGAEASPAPHCPAVCLGSCSSSRASVSLGVNGGGGSRTPSQGHWEDEHRAQGTSGAPLQWVRSENPVEVLPAVGPALSCGGACQWVGMAALRTGPPPCAVPDTALPGLGSLNLVTKG